MKEWYNKYLNTDMKFDKLTWGSMICLAGVLTGTFGWLYEFIFYFFNGGMTTWFWRGGNFLPWINIYATGSLIIFLLTYKYRKKPLRVFLTSMISCGLLEYFSGLGYFMIVGKRCWDYNQEILNFGNIGGFICLRSVAIFGLFALVLIYIMVPMIFYLAQKINKKVFAAICITLFSIVMFDELYNLVFARVLNTARSIDVYKEIGFKFVVFKE